MYEKFENMTDEELVRLAQEGDNDALEYLLNKYKNFVRSKARSYFLIGADHEDIVQEGMIGLYKAIRDYREDRLSSFRAFAELCCDATGISLAARTDRPAFQLYTGAFLSGAYAPGDGVCLETQYPPNAVNTPFGPVPLLRGGETARSVTEYAFGTF